MMAVLPVAVALMLVWLYLLAARARFPLESFFEAFDTQRHPDRWPTVSVIIPARNEAEVLRFTLPSMLSFYYPFLEIVLVDDCSGDGTAEAARELASQHPETDFRVIPGQAPPSGWRGKLWALQQGVEASTGEWILFTDADIFHRSTLLRDLVRVALNERYQMVSLMVLLRTESFWDRLLIPSFFFFFHLLYPFHRVRSPGSRTAAAAGGCLLVERESLARAGGLAAVRDAWIDDVALAGALKRSGARLYLGATVQAASFRRYGTLRSIRQMVARSAFTQLRYSWVLLGATLLALGIIFELPALGWILVAVGALRVDPLVLQYLTGVSLGFAVGFMILSYAPALRLYGLPVLWAVTLPAAVLVYAAMTVESALLHAFSGGPRWKGRPP